MFRGRLRLARFIVAGYPFHGLRQFEIFRISFLFCSHRFTRLVNQLTLIMPDAEDIEAGGADRDFGITELSYESYFDKMKGACCGVCIGFLLFFGSMALLVWNEGRAVARRKDLEEGSQVVVDINLENFNRTTVKSGLVHATALLSTPSVLRDDIFGVSTGSTTNGSIPEYEESALRLKRDVQMYQWRESSSSKQVETADGGTKTKTTYSYHKVWSSRKYYSSSFKDSSYRNPTTWPFESKEWIATEVFLGNQLLLSDDVIKKFSWFEPIGYVDVESIPDATLQQKVETGNSNSLYYKATTSSTTFNPQVGDMKLAWEVVKPLTISIVAELDNGKLDSYETDRGGSILLVKTGEYTSHEMFQQADKANEQLTWFLRFVGFLLMFLSILMILQPISTALDIIPFIGDCLGDGLEQCVFPCIALTVSLPISLFMICLAWLAYRPVVAIPICVAAGALVCYLVLRARKNNQPGKPHSNVHQQTPEKPASSASGDEGHPHGGSSPNPGHHHHEAHGNHNDLPPFSLALQHDAPTPSAAIQQDKPKISMPSSYVCFP